MRYYSNQEVAMAFVSMLCFIFAAILVFKLASLDDGSLPLDDGSDPAFID